LRYLPYILLFLLPWQSQGQTAGKATWYNVIRVVDGDTFWVDDGSVKGLKVRLIGIDAPEPRNTATKPKGYFGTESSAYLKEMLKGKQVRLEYDVSRYDRYGRTLAYAWLRDGSFINEELVKNGYATVMTVPPNVKYADRFTELAAKARRQKKGLWKGTPSSD
jgi:micrococcal nuclease